MSETSRSRAILAAVIEASEFEISMRMPVIEKFETRLGLVGRGGEQCANSRPHLLISNSVQIPIVALFLFWSGVFCSVCSVGKYKYTSLLVSKKEGEILGVRSTG